MKLTAIEALVPVVALAAVALVACGGSGDDDAGSLTALSVQPSSISVTAAAGSASGVCGAGSVGQAFVYGGTAPYRLDNTLPGNIALDRGTVDSRGGAFSITYLGGCFTNIPIVIVDQLNRQTILTLNSNPAGS